MFREQKYFIRLNKLIVLCLGATGYISLSERYKPSWFKDWDVQQLFILPLCVCVCVCVCVCARAQTLMNVNCRMVAAPTRAATLLEDTLATALLLCCSTQTTWPAAVSFIISALTSRYFFDLPRNTTEWTAPILNVGKFRNLSVVCSHFRSRN